MSTNKLDLLNDKVKQKLSEDYGIECIPFYPSKHFDDGLINASVPLTRRERRKLERKKKKNENTK